MEDFANYTVKELKAMVQTYDIPVSGTKKADYVDALTEWYSRPAEVPVETSKVILYFPGAIYSPGLGRYEKGFHLFEQGIADKWLAVSRRVRVADPKEVAAFYGA